MLSWCTVKIIKLIVQTEAPLGGSIAAPLLNAFATDDYLDNHLAIQISTHPPTTWYKRSEHHNKVLNHSALPWLPHSATPTQVSLLNQRQSLDLRTTTGTFHINDCSGCLLFHWLDAFQRILSRLSLQDDTRIDFRSTFSHQPYRRSISALQWPLLQ